MFGSNQVFANDIGFGEITGDVYVNEYFNMSISVPKGWAVQSQAAIEEISDRGGDLIAGEDKNLQLAIKEAEKQTVNLFAFFKYEQGSPVEFNPSIIAVAERVTYMPGIKRGSDYLFHVKRILQAGQVRYTFPQETYTKEISGVSFDVMPAEISMGAMTVSQEYYATRIKGYVLSFVLTYSSELEIKELTQLIDKIEFL